MLYIVIIAIVIVLLVRFRHTKIKFNTFIKKGFSVQRGRFGVYCYCGKQGTGKTYSAVEFLLSNKNIPIYANMKSLKGIDYTYFNGLEELLELRDKENCIIFYDEIFKLLTKNSKMTTDILDFLSQMRKRKIIFITTAQEWLEINMTLRRYCRFQIECSMIPLPFLSILVKRLYNAEQMEWSNDANEYIAPLMETTISKCNLKVANSYDTYEQIK